MTIIEPVLILSTVLGATAAALFMQGYSLPALILWPLLAAALCSGLMLFTSSLNRRWVTYLFLGARWLYVLACFTLTVLLEKSALHGWGLAFVPLKVTAVFTLSIALAVPVVILVATLILGVLHAGYRLGKRLGLIRQDPA